MEEEPTQSIAITFSFLPLTRTKLEILEQMSKEFTLIYNITANRLKSFSSFDSVKPLDKVRKELKPIMKFHSQISGMATRLVISNYKTSLTNRETYEKRLNSKFLRLQKRKAQSKKPSKIENIQKKIDKLNRKLNAEPKIPELNQKIIRIHNQVWEFEKNSNGTIFLVIPTDKISKSRYRYMGFPIKTSTYVDDIINNNKKFGVGQINLSNNTFITTIDVPIKKINNYEPETFIGIDRGINNIATMVILDKNMSFLDSEFFNGKETRHVRNKFKDYRTGVSQAKRLDLLKQSKGREANWMKYINHTISRKIITKASKFKNPVIKLEELNNFAPKLKWNYFQLQQMIEYKAKIKGIPLIYVNPAYTSQTCPKCGHIEKDNRHGINFKCLKCGYQNNADSVGAWNIAKKESDKKSEKNKHHRISKKIKKETPVDNIICSTHMEIFE